MGSCTFSTSGIVLKKTKLGETDLIVSLLNPQGCLLRVVAKGARKPSSSFASRLELFSDVDLLCATGKNLDIAKEARFRQAHESIRMSIERSYCAAVMVELLERTAQPDLPVEYLYDATSAALCALEQAPEHRGPVICGAFILKASAFLGFRPQFRTCVQCGTRYTTAELQQESRVSFSLEEGGLVCEACARDTETIRLDSALVAWMDTLLMTPFSDIADLPLQADTAFSIVRFCSRWTQTHLNTRLKSLDALMTCGLF